jgi:hypothetical protein
MRNLASHIKGSTQQTAGVWEQDSEENIWIEGELSNIRLEEIA